MITCPQAKGYFLYLALVGMIFYSLLPFETTLLCGADLVFHAIIFLSLSNCPDRLESSFLGGIRWTSVKNPLSGFWGRRRCCLQSLHTGSLVCGTYRRIFCVHILSGRSICSCFLAGSIQLRRRSHRKPCEST